MPAPEIPYIPIPPRKWQPLTDAEFEAISPYLPGYARGGRPTDRRKTLNAIFWIACSRAPWRALPTHLGRPDTAHRALRRWARAGVLDRLVVAISDHPLAGGTAALRRLAWMICGAFRRMARILDEASVILARNLKVLDALPAAPIYIPDPPLQRLMREIIDDKVAALGSLGRDAMRREIDILRSCYALHEMACGDRRKWRLRW
jgi:transposase